MNFIVVSSNMLKAGFALMTNHEQSLHFVNSPLMLETSPIVVSPIKFPTVIMGILINLTMIYVS